MHEPRSVWKLGLQGALTSLVVGGFYAGPMVLSGLLGLTGDPLGGTQESVFFSDRSDTREAVVWIPPAPIEASEGLPAEEDEPAEEEPEAPDEAEPTAPEAPPNGDALASAAGEGPAVATKRPSRQAARARARNRARQRRLRMARARRQATPPKPLPPKEARKRDRRKRREERRAERKQCGELLDQIVEIEQDEFWVGREIVNCYRTHPQQFMAMGGAWWNLENEKKRGVRIHVSSRPRGDVARAAGFRRGDIVQAVNGIPIRSDATGALAATQFFRGRARVKIVRGGEKRTLRYRVVGDAKLEEKRLEMAALAGVEPGSTGEGREQGR